MSWFLVFVSGLLEVGWALGLKASAGLTRPLPTVLTIAGMLASFALLSIAVRDLPIGTAYAVWVGIGAVGTALLGMVLYREPASAVRLVCLGLVLAGIVGLKLSAGDGGDGHRDQAVDHAAQLGER
jgi:quaternary ammonium compound-resistance protein SugE